MSQFQMNGSMVLIGAALALAGIVGVFQPPGHRSGVILALLAGAGVGIAGLGLVWASVIERADEAAFWNVFFIASIAGFITVVAGLTIAWQRARSRAPSPAGSGNEA